MKISWISDRHKNTNFLQDLPNHGNNTLKYPIVVIVTPRAGVSINIK